MAMVAALIMGALYGRARLTSRYLEGRRHHDDGCGVLCATYEPALQTTRHSHSAIWAITSPDNSSAADHTSAETKLAI